MAKNDPTLFLQGAKEMQTPNIAEDADKGLREAPDPSRILVLDPRVITGDSNPSHLLAEAVAFGLTQFLYDPLVEFEAAT